MFQIKSQDDGFAQALHAWMTGPGPAWTPWGPWHYMHSYPTCHGPRQACSQTAPGSFFGGLTQFVRLC